ncbi:thioredoxin [Tanacetum coccineum]
MNSQRNTQEKITVYKVNTYESPAMASRYGIRSIPTVVVFKGGEKKDAVISTVPRSTLCTCIEKFLYSTPFLGLILWVYGFVRYLHPGMSMRMPDNLNSSRGSEEPGSSASWLLRAWQAGDSTQKQVISFPGSKRD